MDITNFYGYLKRNTFFFIVPKIEILWLHLCTEVDPKAALKGICQQSHVKSRL